MECLKMMRRLNCVTNKIYTSSMSEIVQTYSKTIELSPSSHYLKKALVGVQLKLD